MSFLEVWCMQRSKSQCPDTATTLACRAHGGDVGKGVIRTVKCKAFLAGCRCLFFVLLAVGHISLKLCKSSL